MCGITVHSDEVTYVHSWSWGLRNSQLKFEDLSSEDLNLSLSITSPGTDRSQVNMEFCLCSQTC